MVALEVAPHSSGCHVSLQWFSLITPVAVPPHLWEVISAKGRLRVLQFQTV